MQPPAYDLAEYLTGIVRAELWLAMMEAGPHLVSAHTDGLWVDCTDFSPRLSLEWRNKATASRIRTIDAQNLAYVLAGSDDWLYVVAGARSYLAAGRFEDSWTQGHEEILIEEFKASKLATWDEFEEMTGKSIRRY
jgi:hypothetical protein